MFKTQTLLCCVRAAIALMNCPHLLVCAAIVELSVDGADQVSSRLTFVFADLDSAERKLSDSSFSFSLPSTDTAAIRTETARACTAGRGDCRLGKSFRCESSDPLQGLQNASKCFRKLLRPVAAVPNCQQTFSLQLRSLTAGPKRPKKRLT